MTGPFWKFGDTAIDCGERTLVMGIVNCTPDSFSDGGMNLDPEIAVAAAMQMLADGADILDVGGESTRPGSDPVSVDEELRRVLPVIEWLAREVPDVPLSVDTMKADVAKAALSNGASIVNDVTAGRDPAMFATVADAGAGIVLMHMLGEPKTMQEEPSYEDVVAQVHAYLKERTRAAVTAGIPAEAIVVDPGIGFGKTLEHNLALLRGVGSFFDLGRPVLIGPSRKRFIGALLDAEVGERLGGTAGAVAWLAAKGCHIVRVHDVREMAQAVRVVDAIKGVD
jgi:dihydropteroate synthase